MGPPSEQVIEKMFFSTNTPLLRHHTSECDVSGSIRHRLVEVWHEKP